MDKPWRRDKAAAATASGRRPPSAGGWRTVDSAEGGAAGIGGGGVKGLAMAFRKGRGTGHLVLSSRELEAVPPEVFALADFCEEGEKVWEVVRTTRLDLAYNNLACLPGAIGQLDQLVSLNLRDNKLTDLPPELFGLETLASLDVSNNLLLSLPEELGRADGLRNLQVSGNRLQEIPASLVHLGQLETLEANENQIQTLPEGFGSLRRLRSLNLKSNKIRALPPSFQHLVDLRMLDLSKNLLADAPPGLELMTSLTVLDLRENALTRFPQLPAAPGLAQVLLSFNKLSAVDGASLLRIAPSCTDLHLKGNVLKCLPDEMGALIHLKTLDASDNDLSDLSPSLGYLPSLTRLLLEGNALRTLRRSLVSGPTRELKAYLRTRGAPPPYEGVLPEEGEEGAQRGSRGEGGGEGGGNPVIEGAMLDAVGRGELSLVGAGLSSLPPSLFVDERLLATVCKLKLARNKLQELPEEVARYRSLLELDCSQNVLGSNPLPAALVDMGLSTLILARNKLTLGAFESIDANLTFGWAGTLKHLDLRANSLIDVPEAVFECRGLHTLVLSFNDLKGVGHLPWTALTALDTLDLSDNSIQAPLGDLCLMSSLKHLSLDNNDISSIPAELSLLSRLQALGLAGNPQKGIRTSILQQGTVKVLAYLRDRLPANFEAPPPRVPAPPSRPTREAAPPRSPSRGGGQVHPATEVEAAAVAAAATPAKLTELNEEISRLEQILDEGLSLSQAKKYALKKELQMKRAARIREERAIKSATNGAGAR